MRRWSLAPGLFSTGPALDDWINRFQVAGVGKERDRDLLAIRRDVRAFRLGVVLDVTGHVRASHQPIFALLELDQDRFIGPVHHMRDHAEAAPVRHSHDDMSGAVVREQLQRLLQHDDHRVQAFDRKGLLPEEGPPQIAVHCLDLREPSQQLQLAFRTKRLAIPARLDTLA